MSAQPNTNGTAPALAFSEAPASATVEAHDPAGRRWLLTTRATTTGELLTRLPVLAGWLDEHGWTAKPSKATTQAQQGDGDEPAPVCDRCGQPMIRRTTRDGSRSFWSCQTRFGQEWCKGKPRKEGQS